MIVKVFDIEFLAQSFLGFFSYSHDHELAICVRNSLSWNTLESSDLTIEQVIKTFDIHRHQYIISEVLKLKWLPVKTRETKKAYNRYNTGTRPEHLRAKTTCQLRELQKWLFLQAVFQSYHYYYYLKYYGNIRMFHTSFSTLSFSPQV